MSLSDLAALGSFISGLAVVVTFVFLLIQMRQTNQNQKALMQQMRSARSSDLLLKQSEPYLAEVVGDALSRDIDMDEIKIRSFMQLFIASMLNWEDSFLQHEAGMLDTSIVVAEREVASIVFSYAAYRAVWKLMRNTFSANYRLHIDKILYETKLAPPQNLTATWRTLLAEEKAGL